VEGVLDDDGKRRVIDRITDALVEVEGRGNEAFRPYVWVILEEVASGHWGVGGVFLATRERFLAGLREGPPRTRRRAVGRRARPTNIGASSVTTPSPVNASSTKGTPSERSGDGPRDPGPGRRLPGVPAGTLTESTRTRRGPGSDTTSS
jgi:4-oxalocrotonate tautomerase